MNKYLPIIFTISFYTKFKIFKYLFNKFLFPKIRKYRNLFCLSDKSPGIWNA